MRKATSRALSRKQKAELKALGSMSHDAIDTSDIPEVTDWTSAPRGVFYRPIKKLGEYAGKAQRQARGK